MLGSKKPNFTVIDIVASFVPPVLAIHFKKPNVSEDILHKIPLTIKPAHTSQTLYDELLIKHGSYMGPRVINPTQVKRILEKIIKGRNDKPKPNPPEFNYDMSDNEGTEPVVTEDNEGKDSKKANTPVAETKKVVASNSDEKNEKSSNANINDNSNEGSVEYKKSGISNSSSKGGEEEQDEMQLQKVYVDELQKEVLMDAEGNLFDLDGNFLGKANIDDEEEQNDKEGEAPDLP